MNGGKLWDLSKILGHSSSKITEEYYAHFDLEHVRNRMAVVTLCGNLIQANFAAGEWHVKREDRQVLPWYKRK